MTTKTTKTPNYTPEMTAAIVTAYKAKPEKATVAALATEYGKTARSIIAKLSREGVYAKAEYVAKNGAKPETKEHKVAGIALLLGVPAEKLTGLESATKATLDLLTAALTPKADEADEADEGDTSEA